MWADLGFFSLRLDGKFCIHGVTGPDEYTTVVNNNTYTNLMARENMWYAASTLRSMREDVPEKYFELAYRTKLNPAEIDDWQRAADNMFVPFDEKLGINPQDDDFLDKEVWDFENTPLERYPLLLHFHPLVIYRYQVIKQADVVLATFLLGDEFSQEQKKRNFDYYDPLTTGDSSLSVSIEGIIAGEVGYIDKAREYMSYAAMMDLADFHGNVRDGCHIASMGGTWMAIVYGIAGMRDYDGHLSFRPRLPLKETGLRFPLTVRGQLLEVDIDRKTKTVTYLLKEGAQLVIEHMDDEVKLVKGKPVAFKI
jgi:alpha,alpha-trehalose phosphorylase